MICGSQLWLWYIVRKWVLCDIYMKCLCRWNAKNKKKIKFLPLCRGQWPRPSAKKGPLPRAVPLPSVKIHWKNSGTFLCRGPWLEALGKDFFKKKLKFLCRGPAGKPSAKIFQKKKNNSLPRAVPLPSAKIFWKNSTHFFAEGHGWGPSAKTF